MEKIKSNFFYFTLLAFGFLAQCKPDDTDDRIPYFPFDPIVVNISNPMYFKLQTDKSAIGLNQGGIRGIIIYRENATTFRAFERNCSYHPNEPCSTIDIHSTTLYMFDPCCNSSFNFEGDPQGGPAWRPLRQYRIDQIGSELTITDEIVN
jgi:hypothetical protein